MRANKQIQPRWPPRAATNGSIMPLLEAQESSHQVQVSTLRRVGKLKCAKIQNGVTLRGVDN